MKSKRNILIIVVAMIVISISTVYATTIIASKDVIYDNSKSGSTASDVQAAIDDLYSKADSCITGSSTSTRNYLTNYITNLAKTDKTNLAYDDTVDKNLRYIGENPNNYVSFNGELWRIIGVMNNVEDANGKSASRVKIIRSNSIGNLVWNSSNVNDWSTATLQNLLNSGNYYNRSSTYSSTGLTSEAKGMISNIKWNLGGYYDSNKENVTTSTYYTEERGTTVYGSNPTTWTGRVGLMYPSDYGYAVGGEVRSICLAKSLYTYNTNNCYTNDWLYVNNSNQWLLTSDLEGGTLTFELYLNGNVTTHGTNYAMVVRPVVYLNTNIKRASGSGTSTDPYILTDRETLSANGKNLVTYITNLSNTDTTNLVNDNTKDKNIRYVGSDPDNYILYNDELWRIIGVMNNIKDVDGKSTSMVKIIRAEPIGGLAWSSNNVNNWSAETLQTLLNSGDYYNRTNMYSETGLTEDAKSMIGNVVWNLGGNASNASLSAESFYTVERGTTVYSGRPTTWTGRVGLMYPSDFGYAVGGEGRNDCLSKSLNNYNTNNCYANDWLYLNNIQQWMILTSSKDPAGGTYIHRDGYIRFNGNMTDNLTVRPVVYLNSHIEVTFGSGTIDDPYTIEIG